MALEENFFDTLLNQRQRVSVYVLRKTVKTRSIKDSVEIYDFNTETKVFVYEDFDMLGNVENTKILTIDEMKDLNKRSLSMHQPLNIDYDAALFDILTL